MLFMIISMLCRGSSANTLKLAPGYDVFIWKEFSNVPPASRKLIPAMCVFFLLGLGAIAIAPTVAR